METSRPASRSPASAAPTCRKSTEPMYESLVTLRRAHQLSARRASMTLCHGCDPRGAREWCGRWSKAHNRRSAIVRIPTGDLAKTYKVCSKWHVSMVIKSRARFRASRELEGSVSGRGEIWGWTPKSAKSVLDFGSRPGSGRVMSGSSS